VSLAVPQTSPRASARNTGRVSTRVTSSRFVGRAGELAECDAALREATAGSPSVIALGGDSGVGKTRLLGAFELAAAGEARFLRGECVELGDGEFPYGPLIGALRELARCRDPVLERLSGGARASLRALLPSLDGGDPIAERDDDSAQLRLFEALLELLELLGEELPVVLVIEDLHWADRSTRAFSVFLARSLRHERVLFVFSYRTDEMHRRHPLLALLSELDHGERTRRVTVRPWGREELGEALRDILGAAPRDDLLTRLFARAEGNPLYTEELLAAGLDGRGGAPQSLRDAFMLRLERLSADAQAALRVLAVAGQADEALLTGVTELETPALTAALREAVAGRVVQAGGDGRFAFRHALLREVAYEDLLPGERAALHLSLARALDERSRSSGEDTAQIAAQVAAHAQAAGDRALALRAAIHAATEAAAIHAHGEAADLLERALESWPHVGAPAAVAGIDHIELLYRAAREHDHDDQPTRAESMLRAALAELDEQAEPVRAALVLERLARAEWGLARGDEALTTGQRALELLPVGRADAERASVLAWLARTTLLRGRYRYAVDAAREALDFVRARGAGKHLESQVLNTLGMALVGSGAADEGIGELRAALALAQESGVKGAAASAYANLSDLLLLSGRTREALSVAREGFTEVPTNLRGEHLWLGTSVAEAAIASGDWALAARHLDVEDRPFEGRWLMNLRLRQAELALGVGDTDSAERELEEIEPLVSRTLEPQFQAAFGLAMAELHRRRGELESARTALEEALDRIELCTDDAIRVTAIAAAAVAVEADSAQRARDQGDVAAVAHAERCAENHFDRVRAAAESAGAVEALWVDTAEAELARARGNGDPDLWARAASGWEQIDRPYLAARLRLAETEAALERGERDRAAAALASAHLTASSLGANWLLAELASLAARARLQLAASPEPAPAAEEHERAPHDPFGLTPRELEVLRLVARGATNREIGSELFMAEKTASVHVSRILTKLSVRSRTQAAAVAYRAELLAD
jgi:DNA-binding CsgD family transcriptional regulator/tetratricopeptide (TPR) repeat protein